MLIAYECAKQGNDKAEAPALRFLAKAVALESAIVKVCKQLKVDVYAAGCLEDDVSPEVIEMTDKALVKQYSDMLAGLAI